MTLLDDFEASHKLEGVLVIQEMLRHVPSDILRRTGVDALFKQVGLLYLIPMSSSDSLKVPSGSNVPPTQSRDTYAS